MLRRSINIQDTTATAIDNIRSKRRLRNDNAAIEHAICFASRLADRRDEEVLQALKLWDAVRRELASGAELFCKQADRPDSVVKIVVVDWMKEPQ